ncbi:hypothetical protein ABT346_23815 [Micromonospora peucetia]|uniref:hypothetical protein n=1 Tax=Micromonospora peucetia TaxID=47871 RepID=UPI00332D2E8C
MTTPTTRDPPPVARDAPAWPWLLFRATTTGVAVMVIGQSTLADDFLAGHNLEHENMAMMADFVTT